MNSHREHREIIMSCGALRCSLRLKSSKIRGTKSRAGKYGLTWLSNNPKN